MNDRILSVNVVPVQDSFVHLSSKSIREFNIVANHKHPVSKLFDIFLLRNHSYYI